MTALLSRGQRDAPRSDESLTQPGEDRQVSVKAHALQAPRAKRREAVVVLRS
jgi:hypothetical protein